MAKEILATPVLTIAVEQKFSAHGTILDATRSFLSTDSIQAQIGLEGWTKTQNRQQKID